jgi:transcriptional regulator with XRE-family HTH domain
MADLTWRDGNEIVASTGGEKWLRERIVTERKSLKWSQQDLAEALDKVGVPLHQTAISKIEAGTRAVRIDEAIGLAKVFDIPFGEMFLPDAATEELGFVKLLDEGPRLAAYIDQMRQNYNELLLDLTEKIRTNATVRSLYERYLARTSWEHEQAFANRIGPDPSSVTFWADLIKTLDVEEQRAHIEEDGRALDDNRISFASQEERKAAWLPEEMDGSARSIGNDDE